jgi:hypothetical protein
MVGVAFFANGLLTGCGTGATDPGGLLGTGGLFGTGGTSLVIRGTMTVVESNGPCPVFQADDGFSYHLRQGTSLPNELFDAVTQIGAVSRLAVTVRNDLPVACQFGTVVVVTDVGEVILPDGSPFPPPGEDGQADENEGTDQAGDTAEGEDSDES